MRIVNLTEETRKNILKDLLKRSPSNFGSYADTVEKIVNDVRDRGDEALFDIPSSLIKQISTPEMFWLQKKRLNMLIHR